MNIITVCSTASYDKFATVDQVKTRLGVTSTSDDELIDELLAQATDAIEEYVGYSLRQQTYLETVPAYGTMYLQVDHTPIQSITSIAQGSDALGTTEYLITDPLAGEIYRAAGWSWTAAMRTDLTSHVIPDSEEKIWEVEYVGGYPAATSTTTDMGLPKYITQAAIETAKSWYLGRKQNTDVKSKKIGDLSITYGGTSIAQDLLMLPEGAERLLRSMQRVV